MSSCWWCERGLPCNRDKAPTPPLVAAPPVPPVVPDSEALDFPPAFGGCSCSCHTMGTSHVRACCWPSGSGVVPDKPALTPEAHTCPYHAPGICAISCFPSCPCRVPAVTDDEAATDWPLIAAFLTATHGIPEDSQDDDDRGWAIEAIADLRSAGFLLVRDHTKET